jgi:hypothetical protein
MNDDYHVDQRTQSVAMISLINLMFAAHPIMPHHGGKILSALLGAAASLYIEAPNQRPSPEHKLAVYTGAVALLMCGSKFTNGIFALVEGPQDRGESQFQDRLRQSALEVKALAARLKTE